MPDPDNSKSRISRRAFGRQAAVVAAASAATAAALPGQLLGESLAPSAAAASASELTAATLAAESAAPAAQTKLTPGSQAEADATFQAILRLHGEHLSDDQKKDIRRLVIEGQKSLALLRAFPLDNADQPGNVLKLYPDLDAAPDRAASPPASAQTSRHSPRAAPAAPAVRNKD